MKTRYVRFGSAGDGTGGCYMIPIKFKKDEHHIGCKNYPVCYLYPETCEFAVSEYMLYLFEHGLI